jgi:hypothetical protein
VTCLTTGTEIGSTHWWGEAACVCTFCESYRRAHPSPPRVLKDPSNRVGVVVAERGGPHDRLFILFDPGYRRPHAVVEETAALAQADGPKEQP